MNWNRVGFIVTGMLLVIGVQTASADDCLGASVVYVAHPRAPLNVELHHVADSFDGWSARIRQRDGTETTVALPQFGRHAHLSVLRSSRSDRFAILETGADHATDSLLVVYDGSGTMVRSYDLSDLLPPAELAQVTQSISHTWWLDADGASLSRDGRTVILRTSWGFTRRIRL